MASAASALERHLVSTELVASLGGVPSSLSVVGSAARRGLPRLGRGIPVPVSGAAEAVPLASFDASVSAGSTNVSAAGAAGRTGAVMKEGRACSSRAGWRP